MKLNLLLLVLLITVPLMAQDSATPEATITNPFKDPDLLRLESSEAIYGATDLHPYGNIIQATWEGWTWTGVRITGVINFGAAPASARRTFTGRLPNNAPPVVIIYLGKYAARDEAGNYFEGLLKFPFIRQWRRAEKTEWAMY